MSTILRASSIIAMDPASPRAEAVAHGSGTTAAFIPGGILAGGGLNIASLPFGNLILREAPPKFFVR